MQVDPFTNGARNQELRNLREDVSDLYRTIDQQKRNIFGWKDAYEKLQASLESWKAAHANLQQENARLRQENADLRDELEQRIQLWKAHYLALEAERDYHMELGDEAHGGSDKNPSRKPSYADPDEFRIAHGSRAGQPAEMRDHHYITKLAEVIQAKFPGLGNWKDLIRNNHIHR